MWELLMYVLVYSRWFIVSVVPCCPAASRIVPFGCRGQLFRLLLQALRDGPVDGMLLPPAGPGQDVHPSLLQLLGLGAEEQRQVALGDLEGVPPLQAVARLREGDLEADQGDAALRFHVLER